MKNINISKRSIAIAAVTLLASAGIVWAAQSYKCPKCGVIVTYSNPGVYKCPTDGWIMTPVQ